MSIELPHYNQEKNNTCALACLRMVLAAFGTEVPESEIQANARMERRGVHIAELERLARSYDLVAEIRETTIDDLRRLLRQRNWCQFIFPPGTKLVSIHFSAEK